MTNNHQLEALQSPSMISGWPYFWLRVVIAIKYLTVSPEFPINNFRFAERKLYITVRVTIMFGGCATALAFVGFRSPHPLTKAVIDNLSARIILFTQSRPIYLKLEEKGVGGGRGKRRRGRWGKILLNLEHIYVCVCVCVSVRLCV